jgi:hypothetical protein
VKRERLTQIVLVIVGLLNLPQIYFLYMDLRHSAWLLEGKNECGPMFLTETLHAGLNIPVYLECPAHEPEVISARAGDKITLRHFAFVARRKHEILAALTFVRTGVADIDDILKPKVVEEREYFGSRLNHQGAIFQIDPRAEINRVGISRERFSAARSCYLACFRPRT